MRETSAADGLTRREALKRGAVFAGALWAAPVVQAVGMRPAYAQTTSPAWINCVAYCIKWVVSQNKPGADGSWGTKWTPLGASGSPVLSCPEGALNEVPDEASHIGVTWRSDSEGEFFDLQLPDNCRLYGQDPSPDELSPYGAAAKCRSGVDNRVIGSDFSFGGSVSIPACDDILHLELIIQCCTHA